MGNFGYQCGCIVAAVEAPLPAEHVKKAKQNLTTERMTQTVLSENNQASTHTGNSTDILVHLNYFPELGSIRDKESKDTH